jgi:hypothetical protein
LNSSYFLDLFVVVTDRKTKKKLVSKTAHPFFASNKTSLGSLCVYSFFRDSKFLTLEDL